MKTVRNWISYLLEFSRNFSQLLANCFELFLFRSVFNSENRRRAGPTCHLQCRAALCSYWPSREALPCHSAGGYNMPCRKPPPRYPMPPSPCLACARPDTPVRGLARLATVPTAQSKASVASPPFRQLHLKLTSPSSQPRLALRHHSCHAFPLHRSPSFLLLRRALPWPHHHPTPRR
jgi:hypothetical protein